MSFNILCNSHIIHKRKNESPQQAAVKTRQNIYYLKITYNLLACSKRESDSSYLRNDSWAKNLSQTILSCMQLASKTLVVGRQINSVEDNNM